MISEETRGHLREGSREALRAVKVAADEGAGHVAGRLSSLVPESARTHLRKARRELLLAVKVSVEAALDEKPKKKTKSRAHKVKVD